MPLSARMRRLLLDIKLCRDVEKEATSAAYQERMRLIAELLVLLKEEDFLRSQAEPKGIQKP